MLFNSIHFAFFFPLVVVILFLLPFRFRWAWLLLASYFFYGCWKVEYLALIWVSTLVDYLVALALGRVEAPGGRRLLLCISLVVNLGMLFVFKYFNFFIESAQAVAAQMGIEGGFRYVELLLPVGISFYTFQTLSYTIDVYRRRCAPEKHLGYFALYVSFFPQLVAGPIERSTHLLPQFFKAHSCDYHRITSGLKLMLWGFFKKLVIADRLALYVNEVYGHPGDYHGLPVVLATYFFAFQIFCDFSGYSDIAIGAARVMGYDLMANFRRPYYSKSIAEFWGRWHISLSTWFRDYLYIPLGGNRGGELRFLRNLILVFLISGLWHGAAWHFVVWGALHALYMILSIQTRPLRAACVQWMGLSRHWKLHRWVRVLITFHLVLFAWVFFRADTVSDAWILLGSMLQPGGWQLGVEGFGLYELLVAAGAVGVMEAVHFMQRGRPILPWLAAQPLWLRWTIYNVLILMILCCGVFNHHQFIYFQF